MPSIVRIEPAGPERRARLLVLDDATERVTSARVVRSLALEEGTELPPDSELCDAERVQARERALELLGYRDRSRAELAGRLATDGYPDGVASETLEALQTCSFLDDERFAESYVRSRAAAGFGRARIARELAQKGLDPTLVNDALRGFGDDEELDRARRALRGVSPTTRAERERLLRRLVTKGFDLRVALRALDSEAEEPLDELA